MRKYLTLLITLFFAISLLAENVTNVRVRQDGKNVVITYDLEEGAEVRLFISVEDSAYQQLHQVSGDVGLFVKEGKDHVIIWEPLKEYEKFTANKVRFMVDASLYECVDLGLSVKWASCDFFVKNELTNDSIVYFSWGDTARYSNLTTHIGNRKKYDMYCRAGFSSEFPCSDKYTIYPTIGEPFKAKNNPKYTKYNMIKKCGYKGFIDNKTNLDLQDDIVHAYWGGSWRMPTRDEVNELLTKCTWEDIETYSRGNRYYNVWRVTGPNGNCVYFVLDCHDDWIGNRYWSSSISTNDSRYVSAYGYLKERKVELFGLHRNLCRAKIRPVCP